MGDLLANPAGPTVVWLQGASCTGCSMSFLNRISTAAPTRGRRPDQQHQSHLSILTSWPWRARTRQCRRAGFQRRRLRPGLEGGVPTAFGGRTCWAWTYNGADVTFLQAVTDLASGPPRSSVSAPAPPLAASPRPGPNRPASRVSRQPPASPPSTSPAVRPTPTGSSIPSCSCCWGIPCPWMPPTGPRPFMGKLYTVSVRAMLYQLLLTTRQTACRRKAAGGRGLLQLPHQSVEQRHQMVHQRQCPLLRLHGADLSRHGGF